MLIRQSLLRVRKHSAGLFLLTAIAVICVAFSMTGNDDFDVARREILLRRIGHQILLQSGDSTSRVLPVKKIADNEYRISFEQAFSFSPESLVTTIRRLLFNDPLATDYVVNVLNPHEATVAYGFAVSGNKKDDIIACLGREQPKAFYDVSIKFQSAQTGTAKIGYGLGVLALLVIAGYLFLRRAKRQSVLPGNGPVIPAAHPVLSQYPSTNMFTLGAMLFNAETRTLLIEEKTIDLTRTETRVLRIFAATPNETIDRSRLQKEIWEDEGVIVGRSLDMFISKLRKKLEPDPTIRLAVVRGKGYKLQISS